MAAILIPVLLAGFSSSQGTSWDSSRFGARFGTVLEARPPPPSELSGNSFAVVVAAASQLSPSDATDGSLMIFLVLDGDGENVGIGNCDADGLAYVFDAAKCVFVEVPDVEFFVCFAGVFWLALLLEALLFFFLPFPAPTPPLGESCPLTFPVFLLPLPLPPPLLFFWSLF